MGSSFCVFASYTVSVMEKRSLSGYNKLIFITRKEIIL